jgi:hypothetical protein
MEEYLRETQNVKGVPLRMGNPGKPSAERRFFQLIPTGRLTLSRFFPPFPAQRSADSRDFPSARRHADDGH